MNLVYDVNDRPSFGKILIFALQQLLAILAATIAVPMIINTNTIEPLIEAGYTELAGHLMQPAAALFGAGIGTLVYVLFTKAKSPVFLGSSFAFLGSLSAAFTGAVTVSVGYASLGYVGLILGAVLAGLVYVIIAVIVRFAGVNWINKLMPAQVIGPTVAIIGLSLAGNAVGDLQTCDAGGSVWIALACGIVTLLVVCICSVFGKKMGKLIPFIIGICAGYVLALIFTLIGKWTGNADLMVIDFSIFEGVQLFAVPRFTFVESLDGWKNINIGYIVSLIAAYVPVSFVVFAEHIADHKNISSIIGRDLLEEPGLSRTLLGDGVGSMAGAVFGGCPNTTYGESVACVAITRNASVVTIIATAILAILISFFGPFVTFLDSIPACVMGGVCMSLYGFIAVSGLKMVQKVDLNENRNLFVVSVILIAGIGGLALNFTFPGFAFKITSVATALILGVIFNLILKGKSNPAEAIQVAEIPEITDKQE